MRALRPGPEPQRSVSLDLRGQLGDALEHGPFHRAFALAVEVSGLSLQGLRHRLADNGVHVSATTLSYWRNGRSRPERPDSLRGVGVLEGVLGMPDGSLLALLGPMRPRGRWVRPDVDALRVDQQFACASAVARLTTELGIPQARQLDCLASFDYVYVGADRRQQCTRVRQVVRATTDRVTRRFVMHHAEGSGQLPELTATRHCRLGRVRVDPECGLLVAELILDRVLAASDTTILEYEIVNNSPDDHFDRVFRGGALEHVLQVQFSPQAIPARCVSYRRSAPDGRRENVQDAWLSPELIAHVAQVGMDPGIYGMRWEWS